MCPLRNIKKIVLLDTNRIIEIKNNIKFLEHGKFDKNTKNLEKGMYILGASGCYLTYFDGKKFTYEKEDWDVIDYD